MARIQINNKWYEQVEPSSFYERDFEERISVHASSIYPYYFVTPFKKRLTTIDLDPSEEIQTIGVMADLAFVAKDYSEWWVVEVEMGYHSLKGHVIPQIQKLTNATYGEDEAQYLCDKNNELDLDMLRKLFRENTPNIIIIANQYISEWEKQFKNDVVVIAVFELFRNDEGDELFRVNGEYPSLIMDNISPCAFHPTASRLLGVSQPEKLDLPADSIIKLVYNNCITEWRRINQDEKVYLSALGRNPLSNNKSYEIYMRIDGQLVLRSSSTGIGD